MKKCEIGWKGSGNKPGKTIYKYPLLDIHANPKIHPTELTVYNKTSEVRKTEKGCHTSSQTQAKWGDSDPEPEFLNF